MTGRDRTALIVVDMQNAFIRPAAGLAVAGADRVVEAVNRCVAVAAEQGDPIFYTRDVAPIELPAGDPDGQTALYPGVKVRGQVLDKGPGKRGGFSGFVLDRESGGPGRGGLSGLAGCLRAADVERVVVVGLAADVCVSATARDARSLGYRVIVPLQATAFVHAHPGGDDAAVQDLVDAGITVHSRPVDQGPSRPPGIGSLRRWPDVGRVS